MTLLRAVSALAVAMLLACTQLALGQARCTLDNWAVPLTVPRGAIPAVLEPSIAVSPSGEIVVVSNPPDPARDQRADFTKVIVVRISRDTGQKQLSVVSLPMPHGDSLYAGPRASFDSHGLLHLFWASKPRAARSLAESRTIREASTRIVS